MSDIVTDGEYKGELVALKVDHNSDEKLASIKQKLVANEHEYMLLNNMRKDILIIALVKYICDISGKHYAHVYDGVVDFLFKHKLINKNVGHRRYKIVRDVILNNLTELFQIIENKGLIEENNDLDQDSTNKMSLVDCIKKKSDLMLTHDFLRVVPNTSYHNLLLEEQLGEGSESTVYRVRHGLDKQFYALKMTEYQYRDKWDIEIKILSRLAHPNIVRYYDSWIDLDFRKKSGKIYLYTRIEPCQADLSSYLRNNETSFIQRLDILYGVILGLKYLHENGVIHRDIKPTNILVHRESVTGKRPKLTAKISDFGCSKFLEESVLISGNLSCLPSECDLGTYFYISPELYSGDEYNFSTDIYSFGVLMFVVLNNFKTYGEQIQALRNLSRENVSFPGLRDDLGWADAPDEKHNEEAIETLIALVKECIHPSRDIRPTTSDIISVLGELSGNKN